MESLSLRDHFIHHIFLPPNLPQKETVLPGSDDAILKIIFEALEAMKLLVPDHFDSIDVASRMVFNSRQAHTANGVVNEERLLKLLSQLVDQGHPVTLHISAQNAGVLISKTEDTIIFEVFELSPRNSAVYSTQGRLQRTFPGCAVAVDSAVFLDDGFQAAVAHTLSKMSQQEANGMRPKVRKAGKEVVEDRDTNDPALVTELLVAVLNAAGHPIKTSSISKNTREEVLWYDARSPWRRSPVWLLLRVSLQMTFVRISADKRNGHDTYKNFMALFMSRVLAESQSTSPSISSDLIYVMQAKLARRLLKLGSSSMNAILSTVQQCLTNTANALEQRWSQLQYTRQVDFRPISSLNFAIDSQIDIPALNTYIKSIRERRYTAGINIFQPTSGLLIYQPNELPSLDDARKGEYIDQNLHAFESWISSNLATWIEHQKFDVTTCTRLQSLVEHYHTLAIEQYSEQPEATSIMLLTIMQIWMACDLSATTLCPLLARYKPVLSFDFAQNLLLPSKIQMDRLRTVEQYLENRLARALTSSAGVFINTNAADSFAARFVDGSPDHQALHKKIKDQAEEARQDKVTELGKLKAMYERLMQSYNESSCEYYTKTIEDEYGNDVEHQYHSKSCQRCRYASQAKAMTIHIHEWPLPEDVAAQKVVVFELHVPQYIISWRNNTMFFLHDVVKAEYKSTARARATYPLSADHQLSPYYSGAGLSPRLGLLSEDKPHSRTHRKSLEVSTCTKAQVCLPCGSNYCYYNDRLNCFVRDIKFTERINHACTYKLPNRSDKLQRFLYRPAHLRSGQVHNAVIASLSDCPDHMSLAEFKALSSIPGGYLIQWLNLVLQLGFPAVSFKNQETTLFVLQCIYQAGPPAGNNILRAGHACLTNDDFVSKLLSELNGALQRTKENWESSQALSTFISIASRVLSMSTSVNIKGACLEFLKDARKVTFEWTDELREKAQLVDTHERRIEYLLKRAEIALICGDSFNVDVDQLEQILQDSTQASILMQCAIAVQESKLILSNSPDSTIVCLLSRHRRLLHRSYHHLTSNFAALNDCVLRSWVSYKPGSHWRNAASDHWLTTTVQGDSMNESSTVHINVLNGELLVDGLPLDRLPSEYESHPDYETLFGKTAIEVVPTKVAGMSFAARRKFAGYEVRFGMDTTHNYLLVQVSKAGKTYDFISQNLLRDKFPVAFTRDFVHWYDRSRDLLEFRPTDKPWEESPSKNWTLIRHMTFDSWQLVRYGGDGESLLSPASKSAQVLCGLLSSLTDSDNVHIMFHPASGLTEIDIPTLQLGFHIQSSRSEIQSREFPKMILDSNRSLGTLIGLQNMLLLKHADGHRLVLILDGRIFCETRGNHVTVNIDKHSSSTVHSFEVDQRLGRLVDNGSVQSKLMLAYLHALTSHCLPDPLTGKTGTEQALSILSSAAMRSFDRLTDDNLSLLGKIASLAPLRRYYPENERVMQSVQWSSSLGFLSQNSNLHTLVQSIINQATATSQIFYPDSTFKPPELFESSQDLVQRDNIRSATFRVSDFGAEAFTTLHDVAYVGRDHGQNSTGSTQAYVLSKFIFERKQNLDSPLPYDVASSLWSTLCRAGTIHSSNHALDLSKVKYDAARLPDTKDSLVSLLWIPLIKSLRLQANRYSVMIWLSTLAFSKETDIDKVSLQILALAFTREDLCELVPPPSTAPYQLSAGKQCDATVLRGIIQKHFVSFENSPDFAISQQPLEKKKNFYRRRKSSYETTKEMIIHKFSEPLSSQWPCRVPTKPDLTHVSNVHAYLRIEAVMVEITTAFNTWWWNLEFFHYLERIQSLLDSLSVTAIRTVRQEQSPAFLTEQRHSSTISISDLLAMEAPQLPVHLRPNHATPSIMSNNSSTRQLRLTGLINDLRISAAQSKHENAYVDLLEVSVSQLQHAIEKYDVEIEDIDQVYVDAHLQRCKGYAEAVYRTLLDALSPAVSENLNHLTPVWTANLWPRLSPTFFLQQLNRQNWLALNQSWKHAIVQYALALTEVQRLERLSKVVSSGSKVDLVNELRNTGHTNWNPHKYPDSLLLEVESGVLIREVQEQIAGHMRDPEYRSNTVLQLNMGEGKSSLIVPIVAAALADSSKLVRVIVAKPQSKQMAQMMIAKLGGLLGRRVYYMPFSRALKVSPQSADGIGRILKECMATGGILLVQPEHLLSFKLMGLESLIDSNDTVGKSMLQSQDFFDQCSRDLVDESDENFSVKFELIYTIGKQKGVDLSPERWGCIHEILEMVRRYSQETLRSFPDSIEVKHCSPGQFPRTRILKEDAQIDLFSRITKHICRTGLDSFPIARQTEHVRNAVLLYITKPDLSQSEIDEVENAGLGGFWSESTKGILLLLRGLFAAGVFSFVFAQKRWRVNYGLDATRNPSTKLAVPYRAKDNPSPRSEFSHPDVIITLTTLCYYYEGLKEADLSASFDHLLKSDQKDIVYQSWVSDADKMPVGFSQLQGINLRDSHQFSSQLFPRLRSSKAVIDYFLANIVFPREMKEFPYKLSASGWDIGKQKAFPTTGFSGTNDSRTVLPLHVKQMDLPEQSHTNALVLEYLLQPDNAVAHIPATARTSITDAERLLNMVMALDPPARVILDVGAQIIELSNIEVAKAWLAKHGEDVLAAVYVNEHDELCIVNRKGQVEALQTSSFATQLNSCLVFLDESHTRGIDLRLPEHYRAAVTLGAGLTKDRLVQGTKPTIDSNSHKPSLQIKLTIHSMYEDEKAG
nr:hypothetical protein CFP56_76392 [Quercus suber]